jgi:hypothetical protein
MGNVRWHLALCLLLAWAVVFVCIIKGIKSAGKVCKSIPCLSQSRNCSFVNIRIKGPFQEVPVGPYSQSACNFATTQIYCSTVVHLLSDKIFAWSQSCEGYVNMAPGF